MRMTKKLELMKNSVASLFWFREDRKELETFKFYRNYLQMSDRIKNRIAKDYPKWQGKEDSERPAHLVFD